VNSQELTKAARSAEEPQGKALLAAATTHANNTATVTARWWLKIHGGFPLAIEAFFLAVAGLYRTWLF
jgi:hypothetical protein